METPVLDKHSIAKRQRQYRETPEDLSAEYMRFKVNPGNQGSQ
jgi:hypothetical protein